MNSQRTSVTPGSLTAQRAIFQTRSGRDCALHLPSVEILLTRETAVSLGSAQLTTTPRAWLPTEAGPTPFSWVWAWETGGETEKAENECRNPQNTPRHRLPALH